MSVIKVTTLVISIFVLANVQAASKDESASKTVFTLQDATKLALESDPVIQSFNKKSLGLLAQGKSSKKLPDPKIRFGAMNVPRDSFAFDQEPMTQKILGFRQMFPSLGKLSAKGRRFEKLSVAAKSMAENRSLMVIRQVRKAWLEIYFQFHSAKLVQRSQGVFKQLVNVTRQQYRAGRRNQADLIRAQLELSMLKERQYKLQQMQEVAMAKLNKWVGSGKTANKQLSMSFPKIPPLADINNLKKVVEKHPLLKARVSSLNADQEGVKIAKTEYMPSWSIDLSYGDRAGERADFISAMVAIDVPLIFGGKQRNKVKAKQEQAAASLNAVQDQHRELFMVLETKMAQWKRLQQRLKHFKNTIVPQASQNGEISLKAYKNGVLDFQNVVRARLLQLESGISELRLEVEKAKTQADLLYIAGERSL